MSTYFVLLCTFAVIPVIVSGYRCFYGDNVGGKLFPQEDLKWQDGNKTSIHSFALIDCPEKYCATLTADYEDDDETIKTRIRWKGCNVVERYNLTHQLVETSRACTETSVTQQAGDLYP
uniref:Secreted protein n=1 Tax=Syphacia muris TaxID=451379 RepID=A0A0N5AK37_9BILA